MRLCRRNAAEVEMVSYTYILDEEERLAGVVSLRELLITPPETPVDEIMAENIKSVPVDATSRRMCWRLSPSTT